MAIYHFSGQVISRSQGRSSVAAAAYRSAEKEVDLNTGLTHDFTKKQADIVYKEILLPENAPEKFKDRETLWNAVEAKEKRKDAQLAREFNISLPKELSDSQNIALIREFVQHEFVDKGMIADVCLHRGHSKDGEPQPHAHVMLTMREVTPNGFGQKVRAWNDKKQLCVWRERWAEIVNQHLFLAGYDIKIDHRSFENQGIDLEPQNKIGPKMAQNRREQHEQIARDNGERIFENPSIALNAITKQQSTFTHHDIARFVNRHSTDAEQFQRVYDKVLHSQELVFLGKDDRGRMRFTTQDMLAVETRMLSSALRQSKQYQHVVNGPLVDRCVDNSTLTQQQGFVCRYITQGSDMACVTGFAGTGKSYMLNVAREAWEAQGFQVRGMTLSGIAAENLEMSSGIPSKTVASTLLQWEHQRNLLTNRDIVVIDEAGMLGSVQLEKIISSAEAANSKVVLIGDEEQLQAIAAGAAYRAISERVGSAELTQVMRQREVWQQQATRDFATGRTQDGILAYDARGHVHSFNTKEEATNQLLQHWDETRTNQPDKSLVMTAYTRVDVAELNDRARELRKDYEELGHSQVIETSQGRKEFAEHDRIVFLRNEYQDLHVKNGTLGTITRLDDRSITVQLDEDKQQARSVTFNSKDYNHITHSYAMTTHKLQGSTVDRSFVLASPYFDRHATYVAMSRHRDGAELFWSRDEFPSPDRMMNTLSRERTKDMTLDYAQERGLNVDEQLKHTPYQRDFEPLTKEAWEDRQTQMNAFREKEANTREEPTERSPYQDKLCEVEEKFNEFNETRETTLFPKTLEKDMQKYAHEIQQEPELMQSLEQHNPDIAKQAKGLAAEHEKTISKEKDIELSRER